VIHRFNPVFPHHFEKHAARLLAFSRRLRNVPTTALQRFLNVLPLEMIQ
jgi:hypothetical protein